jgi:HSP20 family protein
MSVRSQTKAALERKAMNALTRYENKWNPFKEMEDLSNRLSSLINRSFGRVPVRGENSDETMTWSEWAPLVDITEDEKEYLIKADLPEVSRNDLKVTVESGVLNISGSRKFEKEEKGRRYHRVERAYGMFSRSFTLPEDADAGRVQADFKEGVLTVHVAKSESARPKQIEIKVS